jgi:hypothetical protein
MCPQTPILSPEYSHKAGLQAVITSIPLQVRPVIQRRPRGARYNGPDHAWALGLNEDAPWEDVAAGLRQSAESCEGCPCPLCLCRNSGCSEGLERRVVSMPSPQQARLVYQFYTLEVAHLYPQVMLPIFHGVDRTPYTSTKEARQGTSTRPLQSSTSFRKPATVSRKL